MAIALAAAACTAIPAPTSPPPAASPAVPHPTATIAATPGGTSTLESDLELLDAFVRENHPGPFTIHPESEWTATLTDVRAALPKAANSDQVFVQVSRLAGLLDRHSSLAPVGGFHAYPILFYKFTDGWFVVASRDRSFIGAELQSINAHPIEEVEGTMRTLVGFDNETGEMDAVEWTLPVVEYLRGSGVVTDTAAPAFGLRTPDGTTRTVDLPIVSEQAWGDELAIAGGLVGDAPTAVARRGERAWYRIDKEHHTFLLSINDYGDTTAEHAALAKALDDGVVDRVVLDIRYLRGGNGDFATLDTLKAEPRVNRPGGLVVLIGRENESIATSIVRDFDVNSEALLVGEPTPARADNFRCECRDLALEAAGVVLTIPTRFDDLGDDRPEVAPDVPMALRSTDFFAGRDPVLDAALSSELTAPPD